MQSTKMPRKNKEKIEKKPKVICGEEVSQIVLNLEEWTKAQGMWQIINDD